MRNLQKSSNQRDSLEIRIGQNIGGSQVVVVGLVSQSAINEFPLYREAGAGATNWFAGRNTRIDSVLDRSTLPVADVMRLIASGNENHLGVTNDLGDCGILRCLAIGKNERRHRVQLTESVYVGVVSVIPARAQDEEVAAIAL